MKRVKAVQAIMCEIIHDLMPFMRLSNDRVSTAPQTFDDDRLAAFIDVNRPCDTPGQSTSNRTAKGITAINLTQQRPGTSPHGRRPQGLAVELVARQGLTCGQVVLESRRRGAVQDRRIVRAAVSTCCQKADACKSNKCDRFHVLTFLVHLIRKEIGATPFSGHDRWYHCVDTS